MNSETNSNMAANEMKNRKTNSEEGKTYRCKICNEESEDSVDAITHQLEHSSSALETVSDLMKEQKYGDPSKENASAASNDMRSKMDTRAKTAYQDPAKVSSNANADKPEVPKDYGEINPKDDKAKAVYR